MDPQLRTARTECTEFRPCSVGSESIGINGYDNPTRERWLHITANSHYTEWGTSSAFDLSPPACDALSPCEETLSVYKSWDETLSTTCRRFQWPLRNGRCIADNSAKGSIYLFLGNAGSFIFHGSDIFNCEPKPFVNPAK